MNLAASLFSSTWHIAMLLLSLAVCVRLVRKAEWRALLEGPRLSVMLGFGICMMLLWSLNAGVKPGLNLHLSGAMAATLLLDPAFAIVALALSLTGLVLNGSIEWQAWPLNFIAMCVAPVLLASGLHRLARRWLPAHFFVFIFFTSFAGSGLTVMAQGALASLALALSGAYPAEFLLSDYLPYFMLLGFSEAWLSGAVVTLLVVYRPEWVRAFDDRRYLLNK